MRVLGVITARGGSKGVPRKNIKLLNGKPLLAYTAEVALQAKALSRVIISTDDEEIAEVAKEWGVDVPYLRPNELANDKSPTLPVLQHAVKELQAQGDNGYDAICLLQPTSPLRTVADIEECISLMSKNGYTSVISVVPVPADYNPHWVYKEVEGKLQLYTGESQPISRRQDLPPAYKRDGVIYLTTCHTLMEEDSLFGDKVGAYHTPERPEVNIDTLEDWQHAERVLSASE